jgi:hypothetical protein
MGTVYCGPYADVIGYSDHEGYAARILPNGTETGTWTHATREFRGYRAHCACGWRAIAVHPATDTGEQSAMDDWDQDHLTPLIHSEAQRHTIRADVLLGLVRELRGSVTVTVDSQGNDQLSDHSRGVLDAGQRLEHLLDELARQEQRR